MGAQSAWAVAWLAHNLILLQSQTSVLKYKTIYMCHPSSAALLFVFIVL